MLKKYNFNSSYIGKFRGFFNQQICTKCTEDYYPKRICQMPKTGQFFFIFRRMTLMMMLIMVTHDIFKESRKDESLVQCSFLERNFGLSHREISSLMV